LDAEGNEQTDTWHQTLDDAKDQANYEFNVASDDTTNDQLPTTRGEASSMVRHSGPP
jgi:hypothetical protein